MSKLEIELSKEGVRELLRSDALMAECKKYVDSALASLGSGYKVSTYTGRNRVNAQIKAVSKEAEADNAQNNTLLKAIWR